MNDAEKVLYSPLEKLRLKLTVAYQYHKDGKKVGDIAKSLKTSAATIWRLLREARSEGIIRTVFEPPTFYEMGLAIKTTYPRLKDVRVVVDESNPEKAVGFAGAELFRELLQKYYERNPDGTPRITLGGGGSLAAVGEFITFPIKSAEFFALSSLFPAEQDIPFAANTILALLKRIHKESIVVHPLQGIYYAGNRSDRELIEEHKKIHALVLASKNVREHIEKVYQSDIIMSGVGAVPIKPQEDLLAKILGSLKDDEYLAKILASRKDKEYIERILGSLKEDDHLARILASLKIDLEALIAKGVAAEVSYMLLDEKGNKIENDPLENLLVSVPIKAFKQQVQRGKPSVAVAFGRYKAKAIDTCLRSKEPLFNHLVVNSALAEGILDLHRQDDLMVGHCPECGHVLRLYTIDTLNEIALCWNANCENYLRTRDGKTLSDLQ